MDKKNIVILGGGKFSFARVCYGWLSDVMPSDSTLRFKGFLGDDNPLPSDLASLHLGAKEDYVFAENDYAIIGVGYPQIRKEFYEFLKSRGVKLYTLIHPSAIIGRNCKIGEACAICPYCVIPCDVEMGVGNLLNLMVTVGHDAKIGDFNIISSHSDITGFATIGDMNYFGTSCKMLPKSRIGNNCKIAAGSVIYKGFSNNAVIRGNPALKVGEVF